MNDNPFEQYTGAEETTWDKQQEHLERTAEGVKDEKGEERFLWIFAIIILADFHFFPQMETWAAPVSIALLEIFFLVPLGARLGVEDLSEIVDKILGTASEWGRNRK